MPILRADLSHVMDMHDVASEVRTQAAARKQARRAEQAQTARAALVEGEATQAALVPAAVTDPLPDNHFHLLRLMFEMPDSVPRDNAAGYPGLVEFAADDGWSIDEKLDLMKDWPDIPAKRRRAQHAHPVGMTRRAAILQYAKLAKRRFTRGVAIRLYGKLVKIPRRV
jgi:hypothetical protein